MLLTEWNWDDAKEVWQDEAREQGRELGLEKGRIEGYSEATIEIARKMIELGDSTEKIHVVTGLPLETINQIT